jgi:hypothetical protein
MVAAMYVETEDVVQYRAHIQYIYSDMTPESQLTWPEETSIATQQLGEHAIVATNTCTTIEELFEVAFSMQSMPRLYNVGQWDKSVSHKSTVNHKPALIVGGEQGSRGISIVRSCYQAITCEDIID